MKKLTALILSICILIGLNCVSYAEGSSDLENAITAVKAVIDIPKEYSEFNYSSRTRGDVLTWVLEWSGDGGYVQANVSGSGEILSYNSYNKNDSIRSWAKITMPEAEAMARDFIKKINPALEEVLVLKSKNGSGNNVNFIFDETINGIKVFEREVSVSVNRASKKVTSFSSFGKVNKSAEPLGNVISAGEALELYQKEFGAKIVYEKKYDYKEKAITTTPVYKLKDKSLKAISAVTGKPVEYAYSVNDIIFGTGASKNEAMLDTETGRFTPEEIAAIENVKGLASVKDADEYIRKEFGIKADLVSSGFEKDYYEDRYYIYLNYYMPEENGYNMSFKLDAKDLKLLNLNRYNKNSSQKEISKDEALKLAEAFALKYAPEEAMQCSAFEIAEYGTEKNKTYSINAHRMVNGVEAEGEGISIEAGADGEVYYYSLNITPSLIFDSIENAMDEKSALNKISQHANYELVYVYSKDLDKYVLVYEFEDKYVTINPVTGKKAKSENQDLKQPEKYTDISGHWAEHTINTLLDNGYFIEGEEFKPDLPITIKEFITFAKFMSPQAADNEIKLMISRVEPEKKAEETDVNQILNREIAAKYIVSDMGLAEIAKYSEIFKYPFNDYSSSKESTGHISICYAKKIFIGDKAGNFNPLKNMTRAEAATAIFNYYNSVYESQNQ